MASFFSTLFGGGAERDAANQNRNQLNQYNTNSLGALDSGLSRSVDSLRSGANSANTYYGNNYNLYGDMRRTGTGILDSGLSNSVNALNRGRSNYDTLDALAAKYGGATNLLLDSLGVNGSEGNTRATNSFQAGPGYHWQLDQGTQALNRRRAAAGMLNSGNADIDAITYGQGLANQEYGNWQNRLAGFRDSELNATSAAASGRSGIDQAMSNLYQNDASNRLGLEYGATQGQAGANTARAQNDVSLGNSLANLYTGDATNRIGVYGNNLSGQMAANNLEAQGRSQGARNLFNGAMSLATLAAGGLGSGGMFGSGGAFSNLRNSNFMSGGARDIFSGLTGGGYGGGGIGSR